MLSCLCKVVRMKRKYFAILLQPHIAYFMKNYLVNEFVKIYQYNYYISLV